MKVELKKPNSVKKKGSHFNFKSKNSLSIKYKFDGKINNEKFQISVPNPTKRSLNRKPTKILANISINKGIKVNKEDSFI